MKRIKQKFNAQSGKCHYCHHRMTLDFNFLCSATRDHVIPRSKGGPDHHSNIVCACLRCNQLKANMSVEEFKRKYDPASLPKPHHIPLNGPSLWEFLNQRIAA